MNDKKRPIDHLLEDIDSVVAWLTINEFDCHNPIYIAARLKNEGTTDGRVETVTTITIRKEFPYGETGLTPDDINRIYRLNGVRSGLSRKSEED